MGLFSIEHSKAAYWADFVLYGALVAGLVAFLWRAAPAHQALALWALVLLGLAGWSLIEYGLHRFVLHGVEPFQRWHAEHHRRPQALIAAPTLLTATLFAGLVFLPALLLSNLWWACALTLGLLSGYLAYALTHHATHHARGAGAWLARRKRWHARHHGPMAGQACYGVTSAGWDRVFGSARRAKTTPPRLVG